MQKVLLQDTEKEILDLMTVALRLEGFTVYPLINCDEDFLFVIDQTRPHVVVLDFKIDGASCLEALKKIRASYPHLPVIATSCNSNINEVYSKYGFDDYIPKPFDIDLLYDILRKHINSKEDSSSLRT